MNSADYHNPIAERPPCLRSAEWHSAVSQVGNLRRVKLATGAPIAFRRPADCQSATQQIDNLRYRKATQPAATSNQ